MKKRINFIINIVSPFLPILAILIFSKITQALPLFIACIIIFLLILWSITALIRVKEKSTGIKISGTILGVIGLFITALIGLMSALTLPKI